MSLTVEVLCSPVGEYKIVTAQPIYQAATTAVGGSDRLPLINPCKIGNIRGNNHISYENSPKIL